MTMRLVGSRRPPRATKFHHDHHSRRIRSKWRIKGKHLMAALGCTWLVVTHVMLLYSYGTLSHSNDQQQHPPASPVNHLQRRQRDGAKTNHIEPSSTEQVVNFLLSLARTPTDQLRKALEHDDVFQIKALEQGKCPFSNSVDWLPPKTDPTAAHLFRTRHTQVKKSIIWYEHLSKAGGTSFCKMAQNNMARSEVPHYYCMPSEPSDPEPDGRVGLWSNERLSRYTSKEPHYIVSNEWNPFDPIKLELQSPRLVFVTTIRNPLNRLLSAYRYWGILLNSAKKKPTFSEWLWRKHNRAKTTRVPDWGVTNQVGRYNFAIWKFSNGSMPLETRKEEPAPRSLLSPNDETPWRQPFESAIRTLAHFDLVLPMEDVDKHPQPLKDVLGWNNLQETHVVPAFTASNTDAAQSLPQDQYDVLWEANRFDIILYNWIKAVYLTRIHCSCLELAHGPVS